MALLIVPAGASAASPKLEFVASGHTLPVPFTAEGGALTAEMAGFKILVQCTASHGEGEITGARSTMSHYQFTGCEAGGAKCKSANAAEKEIDTGSIEGDLVYIDQARGEVGILLNPLGETYIKFTCGGESAEGKGSFLAPVSPINEASTSFTATLNQVDSVQIPDEYENEKNERVQAIPTGQRGGNPFLPTGVKLAMTVHPAVPIEIKAVSSQEMQTTQQEEEIQQLQATVKKLEEALEQDEAQAKQAAQETKKHEGEANAAIAAAVKKQQEAEAAAKKAQEELNTLRASLTRAQSLAHALRRCEKQSKSQRVRCVANAQKRYGVRAARTDRPTPRVAG
jgi:flagellar biosynthesis GTPase FlhF